MITVTYEGGPCGGKVRPVNATDTVGAAEIPDSTGAYHLEKRREGAEPRLVYTWTRRERTYPALSAFFDSLRR